MTTDLIMTMRKSTDRDLSRAEPQESVDGSVLA